MALNLNIIRMSSNVMWKVVLCDVDKNYCMIRKMVCDMKEFIMCQMKIFIFISSIYSGIFRTFFFYFSKPVTFVQKLYKPQTISSLHTLAYFFSPWQTWGNFSSSFLTQFCKMPHIFKTYWKTIHVSFNRNPRET